VTVDPALEGPRPLDRPGASDAITVAFGDAAAQVFGIARVGRAVGADGTVQASGLGLLFADGELVEVRAEGGEAAGESWADAVAGGVRTTVGEPLRSWSMRFDGEDGTLGFDVKLRAASTPAALDPASEVAKLGGMAGYEQLVTVEGTVRAGGASRQVACRGQRGHSWGAPDWERISLARTVGVWFDDGTGMALTAVRPAKKDDHGAEAVGGSLWLAEEDAPRGAPSVPVELGDRRISTTYDGEGRQRAAGLEVYEVRGEHEIPHRAAGEVVCGTTLDLGRLRLDTSFLVWRMEGRTGVGRYDLLRRADGS
jgi:hypothetical protein